MPGIGLGLVSACISALAYGTFAVPIKSRGVVAAHVHPLIFQSYKSLVCFATAWIVLLWADFRFTWWATLAALIWVTDGVLAIISIHLSGLGVAQSIWSGVSVFVSFAWGKCYFQEAMSNVPLSMTGLFLMVIGMVGLGYVASQADPSTQLLSGPKTVILDQHETVPATEQPDEESRDREGDGQIAEAEVQQLVTGPRSSDSDSEESSGKEPERKAGGEDSEKGAINTGEKEPQTVVTVEEVIMDRPWHRHSFALGVLGASAVGVMAGTMMVPLKLTPPDRQGNQYLVSFGIGVALVTVTALVCNAAVCLIRKSKLPSFHFRVASGPACLAGLLWSIGNFCGIWAVDSLGIAVAFPLVQSSLIVSNCWALFWYREVTGRKAIAWFLGSSCVIVLGVLLLACFGL